MSSGKDFKVCTATKTLAEFETLTLSVKEFGEITWILENGKVGSGIEPLTLANFKIAFDSNPEDLINEKACMGSYEVYDCNVTSSDEHKWEGTGKSIVFTPKSIADKELEKLY